MNNRGVTLVELLVVLAILGLMAGLVTLAWRPSPTRAADSPLVTGRQRAIQSGSPTRVQMSDTLSVVAMPDGSVIGVGALPIDPLTGTPFPVREGAR
jgi:prepilin-type N-terminal cleavage/methylation domain-containing protein